MTQQQEKLSAFLDGELNQGEDVGSLVREISADSESLEKWKRYHLVRDQLRNETVSDIQFDISANIAAAIDKELPIVAPKRKWTELPVVASVIPLVKQSGQLAVAACVTAVMIFSFQTYNTPEETTPFLTAPPVAGPQGGLRPVNLEQTRNVQRDDMAILLEQRRQINALIEDHQRQLKLKNTGVVEGKTSEKDTEENKVENSTSQQP
jgi:sigma-E factor negative regulatory protein RseA